MPEPSVELPTPLPAEVAALGTPEQVFGPERGKGPPVGRYAKPLAVTALLLWVVVASVSGLLMLPGQHALPPGVGLPVGIPCVVLAFLFSVLAAYEGLGGQLGPPVVSRAYLLYKDCLVELSPDRHRIIPWERVGSPQAIDILLTKEYRVPVREGKTLLFDSTVPDHAGLAQAINRQRLLGALGGEAGLAALPAGSPAPFFLAGSTSLRAATYRVSRLGNNLLFLHVGEGITEEPKYEPKVNAAGALGALAAAAGTYTSFLSYRKFRTNMERVEGADERELFQAACELPESFLVPAANVLGLGKDAPSWWQRLCSTGVGTLQVVHPTDGKKKALTLLSSRDYATAARELAKIRAGAPPNSPLQPTGPA